MHGKYLNLTSNFTYSIKPDTHYENHDGINLRFNLNKQIKLNLNQLHALCVCVCVCGTQQGRQKEPSAKILSSPLKSEFWIHYLLSDETQRHALP